MKKFGAKFNKENRQLFKLVGSFVLLGIVTAVCFMTVFTWVFDTDAFGWLVFDKKPLTKEIGLQMFSGYELDISVSPDGAPWFDYEGRELELQLDDIFCGSANAKTITLSHSNLDSKDIYISWFLGIPTNKYGELEIPYYSDNLYYYLGSQLAVTDITVAIGGVPQTVSPSQIPGEGKFLVETSPQGAGQVLAVNNEITAIPRLDLVKGLKLEVGKTITITVTFTFVENDLDQSIYQNFAGECSRILYYKAVENEET